jgi:hypothetical protein
MSLTESFKYSWVLRERHQTTEFDGTVLQMHIPIEHRAEDPQRLADVVDIQTLVGVEFLRQYILASLVVTFGRPPLRPRARAASGPALVIY